MKNKKGIHSLDLAYIGLFIALMAICSWISVPMVVPFTMQTFAVFAAVLLIGTKRAFITVLTYMLLGLLGVPVYSNFGAGAGVLFGNAGGYIIGFLFLVPVTGLLIDKFGKKLWLKTVAMLLGLLVCYGFGTLWFIYIYGRANGEIGFVAALTMCVFPYVIPDLVKIGLALGLERRLARFIR